MREMKIYRPYSNTKIIAMSIVAFVCAFIMLILFIIFTAKKKPSLTDVSKFALLAMIIDFLLLVAYGICGLIKESSLESYAIRVWLYCVIMALVVIIISIIGIVKTYNKILPLIILCLALTAAMVILIGTSDFLFNETKVSRNLSKAFNSHRTNI